MMNFLFDVLIAYEYVEIEFMIELKFFDMDEYIVFDND